MPDHINNRYHLLHSLGQGGMGIVYLAADRLTGRDVALKRVTAPEQALQFASMYRAEDVRLALAHEFQVLGSLHHPHIISVLDYGFEADNRPFFTMDYLPEGRPLVAYGLDLPPSERINLLMQLLQALAYLYRRDIIHRDLKPDNVLVVNGRVKVLDFGLAISRDFATQSAEDTTGTVAYMAPEILMGAPASTASDLYAVGVMAYELFAGRHPFDTRSLNTLIFAIHNQMPNFDALPEAPPLKRLIGRLLEKEPQERINRVTEVMQLLAEAGGMNKPPESVTIWESHLQAAKFVGRESERRKLSAALAEAIQGRGSAWFLAGESGVGKSRLLDEIRIQAVVAGARVLYGQSVEDGGRPFELWRDLLRHLLLIVEPDDLTAAILKAIVPDIEQLLNRPISEAPDLEGAAAEHRLVSAIVWLFQQLKIPVVLLLEDLHWANRSLEPLRALVNLAPNLPLLILGNYRDDETADLPRNLPRAQILKLPRLNGEEVAQLSQAILGRAGRQQPVVSLLQRETEGNAFFVVEVLRALAEETGRLDEIAHMELPHRVVAGGVEQVIQRRLARVPVTARNLLRLAAVSGRQLDVAILSYLAPKETTLDDWLVEVSGTAVLEVQDGQWRFSHDKLREGVLLGIVEEERPYLHLQVARAIEAIYPQDETQALPLVRHWHQAGDTHQEAKYAFQAIRQLLTTSSFEEAANIAQRALGVAGEMEKRAGLLRQLGEVTYRLGDYNRAREYLEQGLLLARTIGNNQLIARFLLDLGSIAGDQDDYNQQLDYFQKALHATQNTNDQKLLARNLHELGMATGQLGNFDAARDYYQQSLALGREINFKWAIAACLNGLGWLASLKGEHIAAREFFAESLTHYQAIGDRRGTALGLNNLGSIARFHGDYATAQDYYEQGLFIRQEIGVKWGIAASILNLGTVARLRGDNVTAREHFQKCLAIWQQAGAKWGIAQSVLNFGILSQQDGDYSAAREQFARSLTLFREIHDDISTAVALIHVGLLDLDEGETAVARQRLTEGLRTAAELGNTSFVLMAIAGLAHCCLMEKNFHSSAELVGLVAAHPALSAEVRTMQLEPVRAALTRLLSPDELQAALAKGEAMEWETAVQSILIER